MSKPRKNQTGGELGVLQEAQQLERELDAVKADALTTDGELMPGEMVRELLQTAAIKQGRTPTQDETPSAERAADIAKRAERLKAKALEFNAKVLQDPGETPDFAAAIGSLEQMLDGIAADALKLSETIAEQIAGSFERVADFINLQCKYEDYKEKLSPYLAIELRKAQSEHPEAAELTLDDIVQSMGYEIGFYDNPAELSELLESLRDDPAPRLRYLQIVVDIIIAAKAAFSADGGDVVSLVYGEQPGQPALTDSTPTGSAEPSLKLYAAQNYIMPRDKLSALIFDNCISKTPDVLQDIFKVEVYKRQKFKKPAYIFAIITADGGAFPAELSVMHRIYFQAAVSLFQTNKTITPAMIWEFLTDSRPSKAKAAEIEQCIEDMRSMKLSVNLGDYATDHGIAKDVEWNDYIFPASRVRARVSGQLVTGYTAHDVSAFPSLRFAQTSGQIDSVPVELITNIPRIERVNNQTILLCDILLSYTRKKNPNKNDHIILLSTIYSKLEIDGQDRHQTKRARETLQKILAHWMWKGEIFTFAFRKTARGAIDAIVFCKTADEMELFPGLDWARIKGKTPAGDA